MKTNESVVERPVGVLEAFSRVPAPAALSSSIDGRICRQEGELERTAAPKAN